MVNNIIIYFVKTQALVPGAKPLSLKEVRLSKDDEDDSHKPRERKHSLTNASAEPKIRVEDKKADSVNDNHTGANLDNFS